MNSIRECDVCHFVKEVEYCSSCNAWRCAECRRKPLKLAGAATKRAATKAAAALSTTVRRILNQPKR